jgi:hypothetical protein
MPDYHLVTYEKVIHHGETTKLNYEKPMVAIGEYKYPRAIKFKSIGLCAWHAYNLS